MVDRTTKALLLVIAVGLWLNVLSGSVRPVLLQAQAPSAIDDFINYRQLVEEQRKRGIDVQDIQVLLLAHIAENTNAALGAR